MSESLVLLPGQGRAIELGNFDMSLKVSGDDTDATFSLLEASEPPGFGPPMHIHTNTGEAFYVLEGEYLIFIEDREYVCPAGSFVWVPQGTPHGFRVGRVASRKLNVYAPAAMVGYFDELSAAIKAGNVDADNLDDIAHRSGVTIIGPVPEAYL